MTREKAQYFYLNEFWKGYRGPSFIYVFYLHIYERNHAKPKWPTSIFEVARQTRSRLSIYRAKSTLLVPVFTNLPVFLSTEHSLTKTLLSRGCRGKCVRNKLIRMEWVSAIGLPPILMEWQRHQQAIKRPRANKHAFSVWDKKSKQ